MSKITADISTSDFSAWPLAKRQEVLDRFEQRVADAVRKSPPTKDLVKQAIKRQSPPRCPFRLKRISLELILRYGDDLADLYCQYPDDTLFIVPYHYFVGYQPPGKNNPIDPARVLLDDARWKDEWGVEWGHVPGGVGATPTGIALAELDDLDTYLARKFPPVDVDGRLKSAEPVLKMNPHKHLTGCIYSPLFDRMHYIRGMENLFIDLLTDEKEVFRMLDRLTEFNLELICGWAKRGADMIAFFEDWGTQLSLMISPETWQKFFKPCYRTLFDETHRQGMNVFLHSCGNVTSIIPDLIEIGLDILDPIQPGPIDHHLIAREFGGKISFSGAIDVQNLMVFGTPAQIKDTVRKTVDLLAKPFGNGLLISPANVLTPEVPLENLKALFEACHYQS
jgi:uroporphyrinogen decarboxylase